MQLFTLFALALSLAALCRADAEPHVSLSAPPPSIIDGAEFDLEACFSNAGDATGFMPGLDVYLPAGFMLAGAVTSNGGLPLNVQTRTLPSSGTACTSHPFITENKLPAAQQPLTPNAADLCPGEGDARYISVRLPFSSFGPAIPNVCVSLPVVFSAAAASGSAHVFATRGFFLFGQEPHTDFSIDPAIVQNGDVADPTGWTTTRSQTSGVLSIEFDTSDLSTETFVTGDESATGDVCLLFAAGSSFNGTIDVCLPPGLVLSDDVLDYIRLVDHPGVPGTATFELVPASPLPVLDGDNCFHADVISDSPFCLEFDFELPPGTPIDVIQNPPSGTPAPTPVPSGNGTAAPTPQPTPAPPPAPPLGPLNLTFTVEASGLVSDGTSSEFTTVSGTSGSLELPYSLEKSILSHDDFDVNGVVSTGDIVSYQLAGSLLANASAEALEIQDRIPDGAVLVGAMTLGFEAIGISLSGVDLTPFSVVTPNGVETDVTFLVHDAVQAAIYPSTAVDGPLLFTITYSVQIDGLDSGDPFLPRTCLTNNAEFLFDVLVGNETDSGSVDASVDISFPAGDAELSLYAINGAVCASQPCNPAMVPGPGSALTYRFTYQVVSEPYGGASFELLFPVPEFTVAGVSLDLTASPTLDANSIQIGPLHAWNSPFTSLVWAVDASSGTITLTDTLPSSGGLPDLQTFDVFVTLVQTNTPSLDDSTIVTFGTIGEPVQETCSDKPQAFSTFSSSRALLCVEAGFVSVEMAEDTDLKGAGARLTSCRGTDGSPSLIDDIVTVLEDELLGGGSGSGSGGGFALPPFSSSDLLSGSLGCRVIGVEAGTCAVFVSVVENRGGASAFAVDVDVLDFPDDTIVDLSPGNVLVVRSSAPDIDIGGLSVSGQMLSLTVDEIPANEAVIVAVRICADVDFDEGDSHDVDSEITAYYSSDAPVVTGDPENNFVPVLTELGAYGGSCVAVDGENMRGAEPQICDLDDIIVGHACASNSDPQFASLGSLVDLDASVVLPANQHDAFFLRVSIEAAFIFPVNPLGAQFELVGYTIDAFDATAEFPAGIQHGFLLQSQTHSLRGAIEFGDTLVDPSESGEVRVRFHLRYIGPGNGNGFVQTAVSVLTDTDPVNYGSDQSIDFDTTFVQIDALQPLTLEVIDDDGDVLVHLPADDDDDGLPLRCCEFRAESGMCGALTAFYDTEYTTVPNPYFHLSPLPPAFGQSTGFGAIGLFYDIQQIPPSTDDPFERNTRVCLDFADIEFAYEAIEAGAFNGVPVGDITAQFELVAIQTSIYGDPPVHFSDFQLGCAPTLELPYVSGTVWSELDTEDGELDTGAVGEQTHAGVRVQLIDQASGDLLTTTLTDANGDYLFYVLPNKPYIVRIMAPDAPLHPGVGGPLNDLTFLEAPGVPDALNNNAQETIGQASYFIDISPIPTDGASLHNNFGFISSLCASDADCADLAPGSECGYSCNPQTNLCELCDNDRLCPPEPQHGCTRNVCDNGACSIVNEPFGELCVAPIGQVHSTCDDDGECIEPCLPLDECHHPLVVNGVCTQVERDCDDGNVCTEDSCHAVSGCVHDPIDYDDNDPCTADSCDFRAGPQHHAIHCTAPDLCSSAQCVPMQVNGTSSFVGICKVMPLTFDDGDPCTVTTCDPQVGPVTTSIDGCVQCAQDVDCDDNNVCTSEACSNGICIYTDQSFCPVSDPSNLCVVGLCHPQNGCEEVERVFFVDTHAYVANGGSSSHYNHHHGLAERFTDKCQSKMCDPATGLAVEMEVNCTVTDDMCKIGQCDMSVSKCVYTDRQCEPIDECHTAGCDSELGCVQTPRDVQPRNMCEHATCVPGNGTVYTPVNCDDGDPCTDDRCDPVHRCVHTPKVCPEDGDACTINERCGLNGECISDPLPIVPHENPCKIRSCDRFAGLVVNDKFCPADPDLRYDTACAPLTGECISVFKDCDDLDPCTTDSVRINGKCKHVAVPGCCRENDDCPRGNKCASWSCNLTTNQCEVESQRNCCENNGDCADGLACTENFCRTETGECFNPPVECSQDPNDLCAVRTCSEEAGGICVHHLISCDDDNACTKDRCVPTTGECEHLETTKCSDGNLCTRNFCDPDTAQCIEIPCPADDNDPCTENRCDAETGRFYYPPIDVDDGNACTIDSCVPLNGSQTEPLVLHGPLLCDDGDPCTHNLCNNVTGCEFPPIDFSPLVANNTCLQVECVEGRPEISRVPNCCHNDAQCHARGQTCTDEYCDLNTHQCVFTAKPDCCGVDRDCDDNDKGTDDSCNVETGECCNVPIECEAPDACHIAKRYPLRGCVITPKNCADEDLCTDDWCDPEREGLCVHDPKVCEQPINPCDREQVCVLGLCVDAEFGVCDDHDACTDDVCKARWVNNHAKVDCTHTPCECNDDNVCTRDSCDADAGGVCRHERMPVAECCLESEECEHMARNKCERATCVDNKCVVEQLEDCCVEDSDCADEDACTSDERCCPETNKCLATHKVCDDGRCDTDDSCNSLTGRCEFRPVVCDDGLVCTHDFFNRASGECDFVPLAGLPENQPADLCKQSACSETRGLFIVDRDCEDGDPTTHSRCEPSTGDCVHEPIDCETASLCTIGYYSPLVEGCVITAKPRPDTDADLCKIWSCLPTSGWTHRQRVCHNAGPCQTGTCVPNLGCVYEDVQCEDGDPCTRDHCVPDGDSHTCVAEPIAGCHCNSTAPVSLTAPLVAGASHADHRHALLARLRAKHHAEESAANIVEPVQQVAAAIHNASAPVCGNGIVEHGEECDGPADDSALFECKLSACHLVPRDTTKVAFLVLVVLIPLAGFVLHSMKKRKRKRHGK